MPLFALYFDRVSIVTFAANLLLVPAFPLILGSSALTAVSGAAWQPLGQLSSWLSWAVLSYMIEVARFFSEAPLASIEIEGFGRWHAGVAYAALGALAWWLAQAPIDPDTRYTPLESAAASFSVRPAYAIMAALAIAAGMIWWAALDSPDGRLKVTVLDVGQGDAILIETPEGHHLLIDGGADGRLLMEALGAELPFWERSLDLVALTHPQEDHIAGLVTALERYEVGQVLATSRESESATYGEWQAQIARLGVEQIEARAGMSIALGQGATLRVLAPGASVARAPNANDSSLVLRLEYGNASFLLTGDIEAAGEEALLRSDAGLASTVLKVPHHGSRTSTTPAFLREVQPAVAVISVGEANPYGHPSPTVLDRLSETLVLRTDGHGAVRLSTDGKRLWIEKGRR
jgi:competence protein ComEC